MLPKYRVAVFVHGCFWHGHDCRFFKWPSTRREFWRGKILGNRARDRRVATELTRLGWRQLVIWECATRGVSPASLERLLDRVSEWIVDESSGRREFHGSK